MNNYRSHAMMEFKAAGWLDENDKFKDEWQEDICNHVMSLLDVFNGEGHSGTTAPYAINMFSKLALFEPLVPLTGEDWEWNECSLQLSNDIVYQNKRCSHVFKDSTGAYDINGIIWWEWYTSEETGERQKSFFTNYESRVPVTFPYTPKQEYREHFGVEE